MAFIEYIDLVSSNNDNKVDWKWRDKGKTMYIGIYVLVVCDCLTFIKKKYTCCQLTTKAEKTPQKMEYIVETYYDDIKLYKLYGPDKKCFKMHWNCSFLNETFGV